MDQNDEKSTEQPAEGSNDNPPPGPGSPGGNNEARVKLEKREQRGGSLSGG